MPIDSSIKPQHLRAPFTSLDLQAGMAMQTQRLVEGAPKQESQYLGVIAGLGVMVRPLGETTPRSVLSPGDICMVRGFTGRYEYSFLSEVLQTAQEPCDYAVLSHPPHVETRMVRQSKRAKASWPIRVKAEGAARAVTVEMVDIGTGGAMVQSETLKAQVGDLLEVKLELMVEHQALTLQLNASVKHVSPSPLGKARFFGLEFIAPSTQNFLALYYITQSASE
jgi:c-di-GMP-binding flagellar brake protein YcgR